MSLREFLGLAPVNPCPVIPPLCHIRGRLPLEVHHEIFIFVLGILEKASLLHGKYQGIDASTMEANAAMKSIVRRDTGERYQEMSVRLAEASGIKTSAQAGLVALDLRARERRVPTRTVNRPRTGQRAKPKRGLQSR